MSASRLKFVAIPAALLVLIGLGLYASLATTSRGDSGGQKQDTSATDQGLTVAITHAEFSGTATFVTFLVGASEGEWSTATGVEMRRAGFDAGEGAIASTGDGLAVPVNTAFVVRMDPVSAVGAAVRLRELTIIQSDGVRLAVQGDWALTLDLPSNIQDMLKIERLSTPVVDESGIIVSVDGAVRSRIETVVSVRFVAEPSVVQLGQPWIERGGERLFGTLLTPLAVEPAQYAFPATPFGEPVRAHFGPFLSSGPDLAGAATIDLGSVLAREGLTGADGETASLQPSDSSVSGDLERPTALRFTGVFDSTGSEGYQRAMWLAFPGVLQQPRSDATFEVRGADGNDLPVAAIQVSLGQDVTGAVTQPRTMILLPYHQLSELDGIIFVGYSGAPDQLIRGDWEVRLDP